MPRATARSLIGLLVPVAVLAACLPVVSGTADARTSGPTASSTVQPLPSLDHSTHGHKLVRVTWGAGRAWFVVGSPRGLTIVSARVRGRALASPVTTRVQAPLSWYPLAARSELLYSTGRRSSGVAALRADGKVGAAQPASPDPLASDVGIPVAAARLGNRLVWALAGGVQIGNGLSYRPTLQACCDESGSAVDHTSLISRRPAPRATRSASTRRGERGSHGSIGSVARQRCESCSSTARRSRAQRRERSWPPWLVVSRWRAPGRAAS